MAEARDFKFGIQLGFANLHHKTIPRGKVGVALGYGSSHIFGVPLQYYYNDCAVLLELAELLVKPNSTALLCTLHTHKNNFTVRINTRLNTLNTEQRQDGQWFHVTSHKDYIGNAGRIKRAGIAETVIIKLDRQQEFSGIFHRAGKICQFQNGNSQ